MPSETYDGPKPATPEQLDDVIALASRVFRPEGGDMREEFPLFFHEQRTQQLHIFTEAGKAVSLVGMTVDDVAALGCMTKVACLGAVCTDTSARGHGLAGQLVDHTVAKAREQGVPAMRISGHRSLYRRRGAAHAGVYLQYRMPATQVPPDDGSLTVEELTKENAAAGLKMFESESIRFRRTVDDYAALATCGYIACVEGKTYLARRSGQPIAVVSAYVRRNETAAIVPELAGSRWAAVAAMPGIARELGAETIEMRGYPFDLALREACMFRGAEVQRCALVGTVKLLDAQRLWRDFTPLLAERIGLDAVMNMEICQQEDELKIHTLTFRLGGDEFTIEGADELAVALFGHPEHDPLAGASGPLAELLRRALPLPLPMYGLNFA